MAESNSTTPATILPKDVQQSLLTYQELLKASSKYYRKILELSQTAVEFATALDMMSKCKGMETSGAGLKSAAELHRQMAKQQEVLAESILKDFEKPLERNLQTHQKRVEENEKTFEKSTKKLQDEIGKTENKMLKGRKKDLVAFQQSLQDMQRQAQELEQLRVENQGRVLADEQRNFMFIVQKVAGVLKNEYDHFTNLSSLARDATEDIISVAFAPPGKTLEGQEKKQVIEKYLGSSSSVSQRQSIVVESRRESTASVISAASGQVNGAVPPMKPPAPPAQPTVQLMKEQQSARPATPPTTPQPPKINTVSSFQRANSTAQLSPTIQDSLKRLNLASQQIQQQQQQQQQSLPSPTPSTLEKPNRPTPVQPQTPVTPVDSKKDDLVIAIHDFTARTERELSFKKDDVLLIKQRQENWLYATHHLLSNGKSGWIPVSYTQKMA